jgi:hypothetical protein
MKRVLVPSGRVALSVYSEIERTPAAYAFVKALEKHWGKMRLRLNVPNTYFQRRAT